jgi:hypothetical protein
VEANVQNPSEQARRAGRGWVAVRPRGRRRSEASRRSRQPHGRLGSVASAARKLQHRPALERAEELFLRIPANSLTSRHE